MYRLELGIIWDNNPELEFPYITNIEDRFDHTYILGKTGTGKSVLMEQLAYQDIKQGLSVIYIDPKGDSCKRLYHLSEKTKSKYISIKQPIVINPLNKDGYDIDDIIAEFVQILDILITLTASNKESTALMREIIGMALRCFTKEQKNLKYLVEFLLYKDVREKHIKTLDHLQEDYKKYWTEFDAVEKNNYPRNKEKIESAKRVASRLIEISEGKMKNIVQGENELYISDLVNKGESLFVDASHMSRNSRIYLANLIVYSVVSYCEFYDGKRKPLIVYVDEFQNVVSELFSELLAKSRGKKVGFVLAHHDYLELNPEVLSSIQGNAGTSIIFRCGKNEATDLAPLFNIKASDLWNLDKYTAYVRMGNKNSFIKTFVPLMEEIPEITLEDKTNSEPTYNFLSNDWIYFNKKEVL